MTATAPRRVVTGHYAGPVSRALAVAVDVSASGALFAMGSAAFAWVARTTLNLEIDTGRTGLLWTAAFLIWVFLYHWIGLALFGKTIGKALLGVRVVSRSGSPLVPLRAAVRVIIQPISFALLGLGLIGAVVSRERRTFHDVVAGSVVVYDWGGRTAELPTFMSTWLNRREQAVGAENRGAFPSRSTASLAEQSSDPTPGGS